VAALRMRRGVTATPQQSRWLPISEQFHIFTDLPVNRVTFSYFPVARGFLKTLFLVCW
jgi:hypothetical protein